MRVVDRLSNRFIAELEVADPEYIGLILDNGAHFWEHEWHEGTQVAHARDLGLIVAKHLLGQGTLQKEKQAYGRERSVYPLQLGDETVHSRE